jgi:hypothetical protein
LILTGRYGQRFSAQSAVADELINRQGDLGRVRK